MPVENLTDARVRGIKHKDGELSDAKTGVLVRADQAGAITFTYRYRHGGARRRIVIGRFPGMSLAEARAAGRAGCASRSAAGPTPNRSGRRCAPRRRR